MLGIEALLAGLVILAGCSGSEAQTNAPASSNEPPRAGIRDGRPVGLFFMTRFWSFDNSLEKTVWYFAPDGTVYEKIETGFSPEDLAAHKNKKGTAKLNGNKLEVTWTDGKTSSSEIEPENDAFTWDLGIFTPVSPFDDSKKIVGKYEGGEALSRGGRFALTNKSLELRADGTFTWDGVASIKASDAESEVAAGASSGTNGRWELNGYSLILTDDKGNVRRNICFPYDIEENDVYPDRLFVGGIMMKRQK